VTLARKLLVPYAALALLVGGALAQVTYEIVVQARAAEDRVVAIQMLNEQLAELNQDIFAVRQNLLSYRFRRDERFTARIEALNADVRRTMAEIGRADMSPRAAVLWRDFSAAEALLEDARRELVAGIRDRREDAAMAPMAARWELASEQHGALLADFTIHNTRRLDVAVAAFSARRARWLLTLGAVIACSVVVLSISAVYLHRRLVRPLGTITSTAERIASGHVAVPLGETDRADEIGKLARAFEQMTAHLVSANALLAESVRARDEFLSIASHELKTPISSLKLHLQMEEQRLAAQPADGAPVRPKWLDVSLRQLARTEALIAALLDVTSIRAGRLELDRRPHDLGALVASVLERHSADLTKSGNTVRAALDSGVVGVWDASRIDQVVTNLVANVVKHAPCSAVEVSVTRRDATAALVVRDHGPGLSNDLEARLFDKFERSGTARSLGGLGLGLYIVKELVSAHGGTIWAESAPDGGATFTVELPLAPPGT
jgi:signal transduction histidine kinase